MGSALLAWAILIPCASCFAPPQMCQFVRIPALRGVGSAPLPSCLSRRQFHRRCRGGPLRAAAKAGGAKGGKVTLPYKEGGGGDIGKTLYGQDASAERAVAVAGAAPTISEIKKKVEAAAKEVLKTGDDTLENFISDFKERAPEKDVVLTGRIPAEWLKVDFSVCLGKGGYGDVFEARIVGGSLQGSRAVAKRALPKSKGKVRWRGKDADGNSISSTSFISGFEATSVRASDAAMATLSGTTARSGGSASDDMGNAEEYLEVEDYVNRLITANCPHIAAAYIGDCVQDGQRWLLWHFEEESLTLSDLIRQAHRRGTIRPLAEALGLQNFKDDDAASMQRLVACLAAQLLTLCTHLVQQGICHRDIKPGNLLLVPNTQQIKLIDFGAAAAVGTEERVGFDAERGPCDEKYHAPEALIEEEFWDVYDVYSVGLTLTRVLFKPLWDPDQFNAFMDDFRSAANKENLDTFFTNLILRQGSLDTFITDLILRQSPHIPPEKSVRALKKATRANLELFTTLARRSRGNEYVELAQLAVAPVRAEDDAVDDAVSKAEEWMEHQRQKMAKARQELQLFEALADMTSGTGEKGISLQALRAALKQNGIVKTEGEVEALFRSVDADSNACIDFEEYRAALALALPEEEEEVEEGADAQDEGVDKYRVELDSRDFIVGLKALEAEASGYAEGDDVGRVTWALMRGMMAKSAGSRLKPIEALRLLKTDPKEKRPPPTTGASERGASKASSSALAALKGEIVALKEQHKAINQESDRLKASSGVSDAIVYTQLNGLKKQKLALKDKIARLERLLLQSSL